MRTGKRNQEEAAVQGIRRNQTPLRTRIYKYRYIYLLALPGLLYMIFFKLYPLWGLSLAFFDYNPVAGLFGSKWVGLRFFKEVFTSRAFWPMTRNNFVISILSIVFAFPLPIILAIMISEVRNNALKRSVQSIVYLPHFMSWVVIVSITFFLLSTDFGLINKLIRRSGGSPIYFLSEDRYFWLIIVCQVIWRETGWGTILFLSAITSIDPQLYEAAAIDGASRMKQIFNITLPAITPVIVTLFLLKLGQIADIPLDQILLMQNSLNIDVSQVYDSYAYTYGIKSGYTSVGVVIGLFKSSMSLILVVVSNKILKSLGQDGIF